MDDVVEQLKQMQGQPKGVVDKLTDEVKDHAKKSTLDQPTPSVSSGGKISTDHMRDFD
jgi:type IV secretion system protein TrbL